MSSVLIPARATAVQVIKNGSGASAVRVSGINILGQHSNDKVILMDGIQYSESDVVLPIVALDDKRVLYSFGKNFGEFVLQGTIYILKCSGGITSAVKDLKDQFDGNRVAQKLTPCNLSALNLSAKIYITGLAYSNVNVQNQTISFGLNCLVAPVSNKG